MEMKLHPQNPTPSSEPKNLVHYTKNEPIGQPPWYSCFVDKTMIGLIEQESDGYYYFSPIGTKGVWPAWSLHDLARKLDALNEAWHLKLSEALKQKS